MSFLNNKFFFIAFLFLIYVNFSYADNHKDFLDYDKIDDVRKTLSQFDDHNFNNYLLNVSHYGIKDYHEAIYKLFFEYRNNLSVINGCVETSTKLEINYNKNWVDELITFAGREYVISNIKSIQNLIFNINNKHYRYFCIECEKNAVFSEIQYILMVKEYLDLYISYANTMTESKHKITKESKDSAENIIKSLANPPIQTIRFGGKIGTYLHISNNVDLKLNVINFILSHPTFSQPFNFVQAIQDLRKKLPDN